MPPGDDTALTCLEEPVLEKFTSEGGSERDGLRFGGTCMQGYSRRLTSDHLAVLALDKRSALFAVFHGIPDEFVAKYVSNILPPELLRNENFVKARSQDQVNVELLKEALEEVYLKIDREMATSFGLEKLDDATSHVLEKKRERQIKRSKEQLKRQDEPPRRKKSMFPSVEERMANAPSLVADSDTDKMRSSSRSKPILITGIHCETLPVVQPTGFSPERRPTSARYAQSLEYKYSVDPPVAGETGLKISRGSSPVFSLSPPRLSHYDPPSTSGETKSVDPEIEDILLSDLTGSEGTTEAKQEKPSQSATEAKQEEPSQSATEAKQEKPSQSATEAKQEEPSQSATEAKQEKPSQRATPEKSSKWDKPSKDLKSAPEEGHSQETKKSAQASPSCDKPSKSPTQSTSDESSEKLSKEPSLDTLESSDKLSKEPSQDTLESDKSSEAAKGTPKSGDKSSEAAKGTPKSGDKSSEAAKGTPKSGDKSSEAAKGTPKSGDKSSEAAKGTPKSGDKSSEAAKGTPKSGDKSSEAAKGTPKSGDKSSEAAKGTPKSGDKSSEAAKGTPKSGDKSSEAAKGTPKSGDKSSEAAKGTPKSGDKSSEAAKGTPKSGDKKKMASKDSAQPAVAAAASSEQKRSEVIKGGGIPALMEAIQNPTAAQAKESADSRPHGASRTSAAEKKNVRRGLDFGAVRSLATLTALHVRSIPRSLMEPKPFPNTEAKKSWLKSVNPQRPGFNTGTSAVTALISGDYLLVAHVGDCRCVLFRSDNASAEFLTKDHTVKVPQELQRIKGAAGTVSNGMVFNARVSKTMGLPVTRSFGHHNFKRDYQMSEKQQMVTALPDIVSMKLPDGESVILLASAAFWKTEKLASSFVSYVQQQLTRRERKLPEICERACDKLAQQPFLHSTESMAIMMVAINMKSPTPSGKATVYTV